MALSLGAEEAKSGDMEPEHILVGLLREEGGLAATLLESLNVRIGTVRAALQPTTDPIAAWGCSFCGKGRDVVHRLIQGPGWVSHAPGELAKQPLLICDECITLCNEIMAKDETKPRSA